MELTYAEKKLITRALRGEKDDALRLMCIVSQNAKPELLEHIGEIDELIAKVNK